MMYSFTGTPRGALHSIMQGGTGGQDTEFLFNEKGGLEVEKQ